ncbi:MAG: hypothetical protein HFH39_14135 [Lachnospiraceae bacterium]|nr:hypothetical protein [Lachnospiraceae bacterium]
MGNKQLDIQDTRKENVKGYKEEEFKVVNKKEAGEYPKGTWTIDWILSPGEVVFGGNNFILSSGSSIYVDISQSSEGRSQLVWIENGTGAKVVVIGSSTTKGWHGTYTMSALPEAYYHFGIENLSSKVIAYRGSYSI